MNQSDNTKSSESTANYDDKGNAKHYGDTRINTIRMLEHIWGTYNTMVFCEMNDFKYRIRMGLKHDDLKLELTKANWYAEMAKYLRAKRESGNGIEGVPSQDSGMYKDFNPSK